MTGHPRTPPGGGLTFATAPLSYTSLSLLGSRGHRTTRGFRSPSPPNSTHTSDPGPLLIPSHAFSSFLHPVPYTVQVCFFHLLV